MGKASKHCDVSAAQVSNEWGWVGEISASSVEACFGGGGHKQYVISYMLVTLINEVQQKMLNKQCIKLIGLV